MGVERAVIPVDDLGAAIERFEAEGYRLVTISPADAPRIADLDGPVVLDFWATWCGPCVKEMPHMKEVYADYKDKGVEFVGVSLDYEDRGGPAIRDYLGEVLSSSWEPVARVVPDELELARTTRATHATVASNKILLKI